jgi:hypothetical protein
MKCYLLCSHWVSVAWQLERQAWLSHTPKLDLATAAQQVHGPSQEVFAEAFYTQPS